MRVAFRADASIEIGTGHIMRCLTLADELARRGHECQFIFREHQGNLGELIASKGYPLTELPIASNSPSDLSDKAANAYASWLGATWQQDAEQSVNVLASLNVDWLVVDHYAVDARWEKQVAKVVGRIMVIDDLADRNHECVLLLDQNLGRNPADYEGLVPQDCLRLIGPEYALLRPEFAELRARSLKRRAQPKLKRILISMGGVDRTNVTGQVLDALAATTLPGDTQLDIIMGGAAPCLEQVRQRAARLPFKATVSVNVNDMAERMCLADLSIGAAGGTSWERCCLGLPAVLVIQAENQVAGARALGAVGAASTIADPKALRVDLPATLAKVARPECLQHMSSAAAGITDGAGVSRVVESMVPLKRTAQ